MSNILVAPRWLDSNTNGLTNVFLRFNEKYIANICPSLQYQLSIILDWQPGSRLSQEATLSSNWSWPVHRRIFTTAIKQQFATTNTFCSTVTSTCGQLWLNGGKNRQIRVSELFRLGTSPSFSYGFTVPRLIALSIPRRLQNALTTVSRAAVYLSHYILQTVLSSNKSCPPADYEENPP